MPAHVFPLLISGQVGGLKRKSRSRKTAPSKTGVMILLSWHTPHKRFFSSLVFATVAHGLRCYSLGTRSALPTLVPPNREWSSSD